MVDFHQLVHVANDWYTEFPHWVVQFNRKTFCYADKCLDEMHDECLHAFIVVCDVEILAASHGLKLIMKWLEQLKRA